MNFNKNKKFVAGALILLLVCNFFAWQAVYFLSQPKFLEVVFFDVGQGDSVLIKSAEGHYILIDGGPSSVILEKLAGELPSWPREIDLMVLTHTHDDHFNGLIEVIKGYGVKNILWSGAVEASAGSQKWESSILESEAEAVIAFVGQRVRGQNFFIDVLYPFVNLKGIEFKDANLSSLVLRLVFGHHSFLFMGDASQSMEKQLIEKERFCQENDTPLCRAMVLDSDVLKVGHHGSKTSSAEEFIAKVLPEIAVISAGQDNKFGHPHQETLDTLGKYGIKISRTDLDGDIRVISDGESLRILNF